MDVGYHQPYRNDKCSRFLKRCLIFFPGAILLITIFEVIYYYDLLHELCSLRNYVYIFRSSPLMYGALLFCSITTLIVFCFSLDYGDTKSSYYKSKEFRLSYALTAKAVLMGYKSRIEEKLEMLIKKMKSSDEWKSHDHKDHFVELFKKSNPDHFLAALHEGGHLIGFWHTKVQCIVHTVSTKPYKDRKQGIECQYKVTYTFEEFFEKLCAKFAGCLAVSLLHPQEFKRSGRDKDEFQAFLAGVLNMGRSHCQYLKEIKGQDEFKTTMFYVEHCFNATTFLLHNHIKELFQITEILLRKETLGFAEIRTILRDQGAMHLRSRSLYDSFVPYASLEEHLERNGNFMSEI